MDLKLIAGTISTTIFAFSNIPMLLRAVRTRNLHSYSYTHIIMNNAANLIHWFYITVLPLGPIWFLHGFYTISAMMILFWYLRYEKRCSTNQSILSSQIFENEEFVMKTSIEDKIANESGKEISEFHIRFRPYVNPIYRGGLVLTGNPRGAEKLQVKIYMKAFMQYLLARPGISFKEWLLEIVAQCFSEFRCGKPKQDSKREVKREKAMQVIASNYEPIAN